MGAGFIGDSRPHACARKTIPCVNVAATSAACSLPLSVPPTFAPPKPERAWAMPTVASLSPPKPRAAIVLPRALTVLGNGPAWTRASAHISSAPHEPLVVQGAVGCGKTCGVRLLLAAHGYECVELDGAAGDSTHELLAWIKRFRVVRPAVGKRAAVFVDDVESLTIEARARLVTLLRSHGGRRDLNPIVLTTESVRAHPTLDKLKLAVATLRTPNEHTVRDWFEREGVRVNHEVVRVPRGWLCGSWITLGDLRRVRIALEWRVVTGGALGVPRRAPRNPFHATEQLLLRRPGSVDAWCAHAERRDVDVLASHACEYVSNTDDAAMLTSAWSTLDVAAAATMGLPPAWAMQLVARTVTQGSRARSVRALTPDRPPTKRQRCDVFMPAILLATT